MNKELKNLMKINDFYLLRSNKHAVWKHKVSGKLNNKKTPKSVGNALFCIKRDIRNEIGELNG